MKIKEHDYSVRNFLQLVGLLIYADSVSISSVTGFHYELCVTLKTLNRAERGPE